MGNCLNAMTPMSSSDPSLPNYIPSSPNPPPFSAAEMPSHTKSSLVPFVPILPYFSTRSNLGTLYILGPELGRGQFGIIHSCTNRASGALLACKSISKRRLHTTHDVEDVVREVCIMKNLSEPLPSHACHTRSTANNICPHSNFPSSIVRLHDVIEDKAFVHLIMELCSGEDLFDRIVKTKCYHEAQAACLMKSLLETVQFCHSKVIMHRDIKPENILLVEDRDTSDIKLADFGLALEFSPGQKFSGMAGSSYYIAPEVLQGEYSQEIDMWSAGVILYMLLSGVPPFWGATEQRIFKAIQKGDLNFPHDTWDKVSSSAKEMITQMLHPDAKLRLTPAQALKHPWIVHHTRNAKKTQLNSASDTLPSSASLPEHKHAANLGSLITSTFTNTHNQTMSGAELCNTTKTELNKFFVDLIAGMDSHLFSISTSLAGKRLQSAGTTSCTLLSLNGTGETLVVDIGQEKYLVSHDRIKKKIGWRLLKEKPASSLNMNSFHQFQQEVCQERRLQGGKLNTTA